MCHVVNLLGKGDGESKVSNEYDEVIKLINQEVWNFFEYSKKAQLRTQLDQYVRCVFYPEKLSGRL